MFIVADFVSLKYAIHRYTLAYHGGQPYKIDELFFFTKVIL